MTKSSSTAVYDRDATTTRLAGSAPIIGAPVIGDRALIAEGAVVRSSGERGVAIGTGSAAS